MDRQPESLDLALLVEACEAGPIGKHSASSSVHAWREQGSVGLALLIRE
jgi:hypothetical protein